MTAFLSAEPCAVSLAWWYSGSCLSAVCLCQCMRDSCREYSLLTSVIILVSLCESVAGKTQQGLHCQHVTQKKKKQNHRHTMLHWGKNCHVVTNTQVQIPFYDIEKTVNQNNTHLKGAVKYHSENAHYRQKCQLLWRRCR